MKKRLAVILSLCGLLLLPALVSAGPLEVPRRQNFTISPFLSAQGSLVNLGLKWLLMVFFPELGPGPPGV